MLKQWLVAWSNNNGVALVAKDDIAIEANGKSRRGCVLDDNPRKWYEAGYFQPEGVGIGCRRMSGGKKYSTGVDTPSIGAKWLSMALRASGNQW